MTKINYVINLITDYMFTLQLKKNYLQGVTTMEELAGIRSEIAEFAYTVLMKELPGNHTRQLALRILSRIEI